MTAYAGDYLNQLSDENIAHMFDGAQIEYFVQWLPESILTKFQISLEKVKNGTVTMYQTIQILHAIVADQSLYDQLSQDGFAQEIREFLVKLGEEGAEGFICGNDTPEVLAKIRA